MPSADCQSLMELPWIGSSWSGVASGVASGAASGVASGVAGATASGMAAATVVGGAPPPNHTAFGGGGNASRTGATGKWWDPCICPVGWARMTFPADTTSSVALADGGE